jgi:hypothetical protein
MFCLPSLKPHTIFVNDIPPVQDVLVTVMTKLCSEDKSCNLDISSPDLGAKAGDTLQVVSSCVW